MAELLGKHISVIEESDGKIVTCDGPLVTENGSLCDRLIFAVNLHQLGLEAEYPSGVIPEKIGVCLGWPDGATTILTPGCRLYALFDNCHLSPVKPNNETVKSSES